MQKLEKILEELEKYTFSAEVYDDDFNGETITNLICLGNVREVLEKHMDGGWIPVEERLPPERGKYLCTAESLGYSYVIVGHYNNPGWMNDYCGQRVVAWQPLPEPYRPEI